MRTFARSFLQTVSHWDHKLIKKELALGVACLQTFPPPSEKIGRRDVCESPTIIVFPFPRNVGDSLWLVVMLMPWRKSFPVLRLVNESQNRFPGKRLSLCGQLTAFIFVYLDFDSLEQVCEIRTTDVCCTGCGWTYRDHRLIRNLISGF